MTLANVRLAFWLELSPAIFELIAGVIVVGEIVLDVKTGIVFDHGQLPFAFLLASMIGGTGWFISSRPIIGCVVLLLRLFNVPVALLTVIMLAGVANWTWGLLIVSAAVFWFGVLMSVVSAFALSRVLGAASREQSEQAL